MKITSKKFFQCFYLLLKTSTIPKTDWFSLFKTILLTILKHPNSVFKRQTEESKKHFLTDYLAKPIIVKSPEGIIFVARPKFEDLARFLFSEVIAKWEPFSLITGKNNVIIDLGANVGYYTLKLSKKNKDCKIIAIEPDPNTFKILSQNCELNNLKNIALHNVAISEENGTVKLFQSKTHSGTSSILSKSYSQNESVSIKSITLDNLLGNLYKKIDWLKIDVEGSELFVLKGASNTLKITNKIIIELHEEILNQNNQSSKQIIDILTKNNFKITTFTEYWNQNTSQNQELKSDYILAEKL
ncbi:FkbM family methyltransferase [Nitrosopumilus sp.]|uniref:FkbM family methyltransferase n=1 Tax=Nitrosopumilus sp. TaxID=2024843 RepID=UPI00247C5176|nr:FkbM family methyltransferase [Nitrosopumilus sp.]MCV0430405.1 FkbM family methyltransferase [Nitrosopumilus sp.]